MENSKIYPEIPTCTICLEDLLTDLSTTKCGHVFHTICIEQSLEIRSMCPNCKQRIIPCNVHTLHYSIGNVSVGKNEHLKFVEALSKEEQQELTKLIDKNEDLFKENNKLKSENSGFKADKEKIITRTSELERKVIEMKQEKDKIQKEADNFRNKKKSIKISFENMKLENQELQAKVSILENEKSEYSNLRKLKSKMAEDEDDYIKSLREKYPFQEQAKQFYEMVLLKKVDIKELRKEMESSKNELKAFRKYQSYFEDKNQECEKLKKDLDQQKKLLERYKLNLKELKDKNSNESNKPNENSSSNFEGFDDTENFPNPLNRNNNNNNNNKTYPYDEKTFNMDILIEKPEKNETNNNNNSKINEVTARRTKNGMTNTIFSITNNTNHILFGESSPSTKRIKLDITSKHNFMQKISQITPQPQQQTIKTFLGKK